MFVCLQCREKTTGGIDLKLDLMLVHDDPKPPINFGGQRSKVKVTGSKKGQNFTFATLAFIIKARLTKLFQGILLPLVHILYDWWPSSDLDL